MLPEDLTVARARALAANPIPSPCVVVCTASLLFALERTYRCSFDYSCDREKLGRTLAERVLGKYRQSSIRFCLCVHCCCRRRRRSLPVDINKMCCSARKIWLPDLVSSTLIARVCRCMSSCFASLSSIRNASFAGEHVGTAKSKGEKLLDEIRQQTAASD